MGRLSFNRLVQQDLTGILECYESETGERAFGERFYEEYRKVLERIAENPTRFSLHRLGTRRAHFSRFPYSVVYRVMDNSGVRVLLLRHDKRDPEFGMKRA